MCHAGGDGSAPTRSEIARTAPALACMLLSMSLQAIALHCSGTMTAPAHARMLVYMLLGHYAPRCTHRHTHTHTRLCATPCSSRRLSLQGPFACQSGLLCNYASHVPLAGIVQHGDAAQHRGPPRDLLDHNLVDKWLRGVGHSALISCSEHHNVRMSTLVSLDVCMHWLIQRQVIPAISVQRDAAAQHNAGPLDSALAGLGGNGAHAQNAERDLLRLLRRRCPLAVDSGRKLHCAVMPTSVTFVSHACLCTHGCCQ